MWCAYKSVTHQCIYEVVEYPFSVSPIYVYIICHIEHHFHTLTHCAAAAAAKKRTIYFNRKTFLYVCGCAHSTIFIIFNVLECCCHPSLIVASSLRCCTFYCYASDAIAQLFIHTHPHHHPLTAIFYHRI